MAYKNIKKNPGRDFNFFEKKDVNWTQFGAPDGYTLEDGYGPDLIITFPTKCLIFNIESSISNQVVEYSFNGRVTHGELAPGTNRQTITFQDRVVSMIWFRLKAGASGPVRVSVEAWG